jgi:hypothetical protein
MSDQNEPITLMSGTVHLMNSTRHSVLKGDMIAVLEDNYQVNVSAEIREIRSRRVSAKRRIAMRELSRALASCHRMDVDHHQIVEEIRAANIQWFIQMHADDPKYAAYVSQIRKCVQSCHE